ncbi:MAG: AI-2E family transporter, partial [Christensenellaceae bacterium]|nr:AI-2E family transporter [Christensenellaceae bacterium]
GGLTLAAMLVLRLPNAPLISAIMTIFNMIPFFGPFLGAVPSVLLLLLEDPYYALLFIIITILVQFIDNQFLTPKIVGDRIGINPFWVLFSIILGGFFGGVPGMFFGVHIFAVLMAILKLFVNNRLRRKGLSTKTEDYHTHKVSK